MHSDYFAWPPRPHGFDTRMLIVLWYTCLCCSILPLASFIWFSDLIKYLPSLDSAVLKQLMAPSLPKTSLPNNAESSLVSSLFLFQTCSYEVYTVAHHRLYGLALAPVALQLWLFHNWAQFCSPVHSGFAHWALLWWNNALSLEVFHQAQRNVCYNILY